MKRWPSQARQENTGATLSCIAAAGEILLKRDPANTAPAEDAFLTAIAVAQQQRARSFDLGAALDLARLL